MMKGYLLSAMLCVFPVAGAWAEPNENDIRVTNDVLTRVAKDYASFNFDGTFNGGRTPGAKCHAEITVEAGSLLKVFVTGAEAWPPQYSTVLVDRLSRYWAGNVQHSCNGAQCQTYVGGIATRSWDGNGVPERANININKFTTNGTEYRAVKITGGAYLDCAASEPVDAE